MENNAPCWSIRSLADHLGVCPDKIYQAIREKKLKAKKFGQRVIITPEAAQAFIDAMPDLEL